MASLLVARQGLLAALGHGRLHLADPLLAHLLLEGFPALDYRPVRGRSHHLLGSSQPGAGWPIEPVASGQLREG